MRTVIENRFQRGDAGVAGQPGLGGEAVDAGDLGQDPPRGDDPAARDGQQCRVHLAHHAGELAGQLGDDPSCELADPGYQLAVELVRSSGGSIPQIADELGVSPQSLRNWGPSRLAEHIRCGVSVRRAP